MLATVELISFHAGVAFLAAIAYVVFALVLKDATAQILRPELIAGFTLAVVCVVSWFRKAYSVAKWMESKPHISSAILAVGHVGPAYAIWMSILMFSSGQASGVVYAIAGAWALPFYLIGVALCLAHLDT